MAGIERQEDENSEVPTEIELVARFLLGQIKREDLSEEGKSILNLYLGLLEEDPTVKDAVYTRKNEIVFLANNGRKIPLFTDEELVLAKKNQAKKHVALGLPIQMSMFENLHLEDSFENLVILDPEKNIADLHKSQQHFFTRKSNKIIEDEINYKKQKLRDLIGLPVARGKSEHVNNKFYKYLVNRIVTFDTFGVFSEYDRVISKTPPELEQKISEVRDLIAELLSGLLNQRERFQKFDSFIREYTEKWGQ